MTRRRREAVAALRGVATLLTEEAEEIVNSNVNSEVSVRADEVHHELIRCILACNKDATARLRMATADVYMCSIRQDMTYGTSRNVTAENTRKDGEMFEAEARELESEEDQ